MTSSSEPAPAPEGPAAPALPGETPIARLVRIMATLRSERGCPWDREQSLDSLKPFLIEESYEVLDAIESGNRKLLEEELGDVLLQVVFQAQICAEEGSFRFDDVATHISDKLVRRHPHIFGDVQVADSAEVIRNWEAIKKQEKGERARSAVEGIPRHLPALEKADKVQRKVARLGFDWGEVEGVIGKIDEEVGEIKQALKSGQPDLIREEIGDLLFAAVNLSRFLGHNAEELLNLTVAKFTRRFQEIEKRLHAEGRQVTDCDLAELDRIWDEVKRAEAAR